MKAVVGEVSMQSSSRIDSPDLQTPRDFDVEVASESFVFEPLKFWSEVTPNQMALVGRECSYTYAELEAETNSIARALSNHGVKHGSRVVMVLPRGHEAIILLISVLKCGACYVPLDADTPAERLHLCFEDCSPDLIVILDERGSKGVTDKYKFIHIDELIEASSFESEEPLPLSEIGATSDDLAYVIFTSGTTGRPKGVMITHRSLTNFVRGDQEVCMKVLSSDRVFQGFSPASDGHHEEVWPTFQAGATLVVASSDDIHNGPDLGAFLTEFQVTIISCAPTLLSMVENDVPSLTRILFGAERCPPEMVRRWWKPNREIINTYGPTEATVGATYGYCQPDEPITIGKPLPNYYCHILDSQLMPVPEGEEGELCISGIGLSAGYLGNSDLTAQKFIPNPLAVPGQHNQLLYRTGDLSRLNVDGNIEWLGRIDSQVKIRGYRIELSDIESHLVEIESIRAAVVVIRDADAPSPTLVALVVPKNGMQIDATQCMDHLRAELPSYMVPHSLELLESLPVLPSGKIDRKLIATLKGEKLVARRAVYPPKTVSESLLVSIWQSIFSVEEVSRTDNFFLDMGGYSLLAANFISKLRNDGGMKKASVLDLYENPVLCDFAAHMDRSALEDLDQPTRKVPEFEPVPASRYRIAKIVQGFGILFLFGLKALFWLAPIITAAYYSDIDFHHLGAIGIGLLVHAVLVPTTLLLAVAIKWIVIGKFKEGEHPVWGGYFLRWWFVQRVCDLAPKEYITGTPLASLYLRALGAKIGRNCTLESLDIDCPDLLEIGDNTVIDCFSWVRNSHIAHGHLNLRRIKIGEGCNIGIRGGVAGGATMERGSVLGDLSCLREGATIPAGQQWVGSPASHRGENSFENYDPNAQTSRSRRIGYGIIQSLLVLVLPLIDMIPFAGSTLLFYQLTNKTTDYLFAPLFSVLLVFAACIMVLIVKWTILGRVKPGVYDAPSFFTLRKWFVDKLLDLQKDSIMPVYDTLYARPWCIGLGMKCGPRCEIALPARLPYDLFELGEEGFLASDNSIGLPIRRNGKLTLENTVTGKRVFIGNNSVIPQGRFIPDDTLLGALSVCPTSAQMGDIPNQSWLGSPAFKMPSRQHFEQFDPSLTYKPSFKLYMERLFRETFRIVLPSLAVLQVAVLMIIGFNVVWDRTSLVLAIATTPFMYLAAVILGIIEVFLLKKLLIGTYKPTVQPLWSKFVWNAETFSVFFHDFGASMFVGCLLGTPYMNGFLKLMGANIGPRAFIDTSDLTEFDLINIGEDAAINFNAPLQAHLFEDRVMKVGKLNIGARSSVGCFSVILFDSVIEPDSHVGHISLVMKGETIPTGTFWEGSPAQSQS